MLERQLHQEGTATTRAAADAECWRVIGWWQVLKGAQRAMQGAGWGMAGPAAQVQAHHGTCLDLTGHSHVADMRLLLTLSGSEEGADKDNCVDGDALQQLLMLDPQKLPGGSAAPLQRLIRKMTVSFD